MIARVAALLRELRLSRPWSYKAPFLISVPYAVIALADLPLRPSLAAILGSVVTILGIAGLAYLLNDLADREVDARAGKPNFVAGRSAEQVALLGGTFGALAMAPWLVVLPLTRTTGALLGLELVLLAAYSLPPARLKDRGGFGAAADALYAHALPAVLAALTFGALGAHPAGALGGFVALLGAWQLALGLRNILLHQLGDLAADRAAGSRTWAMSLGSERGERVLRRVVVPAELMLFAVWLAWLAPSVRPLLPGLLACVLFTSAVIRFRWRRPLPRDLRGLLFNYVDDFVVEWVPLLVLLELVLRDPAFAVLLAVHLLLFPKNALRRAFQELRGGGA